jgi:hypothetical protein
MIKHGLCHVCHNEISSELYLVDTDAWLAKLEASEGPCVVVAQDWDDYAPRDRHITYLVCARHLREMLQELENGPVS